MCYGFEANLLLVLFNGHISNKSNKLTHAINND